MTKILALNAYHGGSHRAFLAQWMQHSSHVFTSLTLPAYKWKWRMRHAAITFSDQLRESTQLDDPWDVLFCTDMLNLAEFRGLAPSPVSELPTVAYFHENQLTYPSRGEDDRDLHFAFTNMTTALAADRVWFNSNFHRTEFLNALDVWMRRMPDYEPRDVARRIEAKSEVHSPGIDYPTQLALRDAGPLRIVWVARWEHDKDPEMFFRALELFDAAGGDFRLSVLGESFQEVPECFERAKIQIGARIDRWGFQEDRQDYLDVLAASDVVVSTAQHEFFGIGVLEAVAAGCFPLVPRRLAYPELFGDAPDFYHDGTAAGLARRLGELASRRDSLVPPHCHEAVARFAWANAARRMDDAIDTMLG